MGRWVFLYLVCIVPTFFDMTATAVKSLEKPREAADNLQLSFRYLR